jgi:hypothetical protein
MGGEPFNSEITLSNRGTSDATLDLTYSAAFGSGSGTVQDHLAPGKQRIIRDSISYLRNLGLQIPASGDTGGPLRVQFSGIHSSEGAVTVRTTAPVPDGHVGVSYPGIPTASVLTDGPAYICGLRQNAQDRSNLAVQNLGSADDGNIDLLISVYGNENVSTPLQPLFAFEATLAPGEFQQFTGVLTRAENALSNGFAKVERIQGTASFYTYGVINDQYNGDGSFISPISEETLKGRKQLTLPVVLEAGPWTSEVILTNLSSQKKALRCSFVAEGIESPNSTASLLISLNPWQQIFLPQIVHYFREKTSQIGDPGTQLVGPLFVEAVGGTLDGVTGAARTTYPGKKGQYGLYYPAVPGGTGASSEAWVFGLQQDADSRTNLAIVNTGEIDASAAVFSIEVFDGETGASMNEVTDIAVKARHWLQLDSILANWAPGVSQGYVRIARTAGTNPFVAYAVVNDGGRPGEGTGDATFIMMAPEK